MNDDGPAPSAPKVDGRAPSLPRAAATATRPRPDAPAAPPVRVPGAAPEGRGPVAPRVAVATPPAQPEAREVPVAPAPSPAAPVAAPAADAPAVAGVEPATRVEQDAAATAEPASPVPPAPPIAPDVAVPEDAAAEDPIVEPVPAETASGRPRPSVPTVEPPPAIGSSLRREPVPDEAVVRRRRGVTPTPPQPPFVADDADDEYRWRIQLPSSLFRKVTLRVGDDALEVAGRRVELEDIADVRFKLEVEAALIRKAASARMTMAFALADGSSVRFSARNAASSRHATAIVEALTYVWTLLGDTAGAEQRTTMIEKIERGQEVQVGRLRLTSIGVAWKRHPIARWSQLDDPHREGLDVIIPLRDGDPIVVPLTDDDAYMLPALVPALRRRFG